MSTLHVNPDLVRKYNVPGPRYTSYPPATQFADVTDRRALTGKIHETASSDRDLSLYFHLPFCQSLCWYCGCTTVITTDQKVSATYVNYLEKEIDLLTPHFNRARKVVQLHLGGGTPTFLTPPELKRLGDIIRNRFDFAPNLEAGVEIDPRRVSRDHISALRDIGFNRASIGVQDNNPLVQKAVHRIQPFAQTKQTIDWLRQAGFSSVNIDLIYGLPYQTPATFEQTLKEVLSLKPNRFAVFSYAHVPWIKPAQKIVEGNVLPSAETKLALLKLTIEKLTCEGYVYIGMDHFAREDDELAISQREKTLQRNFQGYSTRGQTDIFGFGMSSISQGADVYWQNLKDLPDYYKSIDAGELPLAKSLQLTPEDELRRTTIMRLMCDLQLDFAEMSRNLGIDFADYFAAELASLDEMEADGLILKTPEGIYVTSGGRLFIRNIAMRFDSYLPKLAQKRFSKTV
jgi:oxygen-independent coproporphyrinogen III oxidase